MSVLQQCPVSGRCVPDELRERGFFEVGALGEPGDRPLGYAMRCGCGAYSHAVGAYCRACGTSLEPLEARLESELGRRRAGHLQPPAVTHNLTLARTVEPRSAVVGFHGGLPWVFDGILPYCGSGSLPRRPLSLQVHPQDGAALASTAVPASTPLLQHASGPEGSAHTRDVTDSFGLADGETLICEPLSTARSLLVATGTRLLLWPLANVRRDAPRPPVAWTPLPDAADEVCLLHRPVLLEQRRKVGVVWWHPRTPESAFLDVLSLGTDRMGGTFPAEPDARVPIDLEQTGPQWVFAGRTATSGGDGCVVVHGARISAYWPARDTVDGYHLDVAAYRPAGPPRFLSNRFFLPVLEREGAGFAARMLSATRNITQVGGRSAPLMCEPLPGDPEPRFVVWIGQGAGASLLCCGDGKPRFYSKPASSSRPEVGDTDRVIDAASWGPFVVVSHQTFGLDQRRIIKLFDFRQPTGAVERPVRVATYPDGVGGVCVTPEQVFVLADGRQLDVFSIRDRGR